MRNVPSPPNIPTAPKASTPKPKISLLQAIKQKAPTEVDPKKLAEGEKYPINIYSCGHGNYGRLAQGDEKPYPVFVQGKALEPMKLTKIACGAAHILGLTDNAQIVSWGKCHFGQLGHGQQDCDRYLPTFIQSVKSIVFVAIACGDSFSMGISADGTLWTWGCGYYGPLGHGDQTTVLEPKKVDAFKDKKVTFVSGGAFHSAAILEGGEIYVWGRNDEGQLGLGDLVNRNTPQPVDKLKRQKISYIACGKSHTVCSSGAIGEVYSWGSNKDCQLGLPPSPKHIYPLPEKVLFPELENIVSLSAGNTHTLLRSGDGSIFCFGWDKKPFKLKTKMLSIASGEMHSMGISETFQLVTWGNTDYGKLGHFHATLNPGERHMPKFNKNEKIISIGGGSNHTVFVTIP